VSPPDDATPPDFLKWAVKLVPATKFAVAVAGVAVAMLVAYAAAVKSGILNPAVLVFGVIVMFILMWGMYIFAEFARRGRKASGPARVMSWTFVVLVSCTGALLVTTTFFGYPKLITQLLGVEPSAKTLLAPLNGRAWVLLGDVEWKGDSPALTDGHLTFQSGPFFSYRDGADATKKLSLHSQIRLAKERALVIVDHANSCLAKQDMPPSAREDSLFPAGYTGIKLPAGAEVEVRRLDYASKQGSNEAVLWAQVAPLP
jgi:hypothetical protein